MRRSFIHLKKKEERRIQPHNPFLGRISHTCSVKEEVCQEEQEKSMKRTEIWQSGLNRGKHVFIYYAIESFLESR